MLIERTSQFSLSFQHVLLPPQSSPAIARHTSPDRDPRVAARVPVRSPRDT